MTFEAQAAAFKALGDPTRLRIYHFLTQCQGRVAVEESGDVRRAEGVSVGEVCCRVTGLDKAASTISFHLKELKEAGLIEVERRGRHILCRISSGVQPSLASVFAGVVPEEHPMEPVHITTRPDVRELVKSKYGEAALRVLKGEGGACCGETAAGQGESCCSGQSDPITSNLYSQIEEGELPEAAVLASLGCGNPTALAQLGEGEIVLDLGSGGGIDVLLSAKRVGPTGFAYGLDMTDEMLELAERNRREAGAENVKFLKGHIEQIPLPDASVDVVISNCVINLSSDKDRVLAEAFRVLRPGGRFAVSDVVVEGDIPEAIRKDMELYVGCVAGALEKDDYLARLKQAGFVAASIEPTRRYTFSAIEGSWAPKGVAGMTEEEKAAVDGKIMGAFIRGRKPR